MGSRLVTIQPAAALQGSLEVRMWDVAHSRFLTIPGWMTRNPEPIPRRLESAPAHLI